MVCGKIQFFSVKAILSQLKSCSHSRDLEQARKIHARLLDTGLDTDLYVASCLINVYSKCGSVTDAARVFSAMENRDTVAWNSIIQAYAQAGHLAVRAFDLFLAMEEEEDQCLANARTFTALFSAVATLAAIEPHRSMEFLERGMALHARSRRVPGDVFLGSSLIAMYSKCRSMDDARRAFDEMECPDIVSWNALMLGCVENGQPDAALQLFQSLLRSSTAANSRSSVAAIKACSFLAKDYEEEQGPKLLVLEIGMALHRNAAKSNFVDDLFVGNCLIDMYAKCGSLIDARSVFDNIPASVRDSISWNSMLLGYIEHGMADSALELYREMVSSSRSRTDMWTFSTVLKACSVVPSLEPGRTIHGEICRRGIEPDDVLLTALIGFYGRCCKMPVAQHLFDCSSSRSMITWNTLLEGYSQRGESQQAFRVFTQLLDRGLSPDSGTFLSILAVCSHCGMIEEGKRYFQAMSSSYGVPPSIDHYHCVIDLLARANELEDAMVIANTMPVKGDEFTTKIFITASTKQ